MLHAWVKISQEESEEEKIDKDLSLGNGKHHRLRGPVPHFQNRPQIKGINFTQNQNKDEWRSGFPGECVTVPRIEVSSFVDTIFFS